MKRKNFVKSSLFIALYTGKKQGFQYYKQWIVQIHIKILLNISKENVHMVNPI